MKIKKPSLRRVIIYVRNIIKLILIIFFIIPVNLFGIFPFKSINQVEAGSHTITTSVEFNNGYYNNTEGNTKQGELKLKADGTWSNTVVKRANTVLTSGTAVTGDGNYIYVLASNDIHFTRYLPAEDRWQELADAPYTARYGADIQVIGDYIYAIFGGYQKKFARYSIYQDTWETLIDLQDYVIYGASIGTDGTDAFILRGSNTTDFWKYDISDESFSTLRVAPANMYTGAHLVYYNGFFYTPRGNNQRNMYKYDVINDTWSSVADSPAGITFNDDHNLAIKGDVIYINRGSNTNTFYQYDISDNEWLPLTNTPTTNRYVGMVYNESDDMIYFFRGNGTQEIWKYDPDTGNYDYLAYLLTNYGTGADLVYYGGYLYGPRGSSSNFYRYNISGNSWEARTSALGNIQYDCKGVAAGSYLYFFQGNSTAFYRYDPAGNSWGTAMASTLASAVNGCALAYPGTGDYIYALRGANTASFYRYSITGDSWGADADVEDLPSPARAYLGSRLVSDGTDIYALVGGSGEQGLYKFDIDYDADGQWTKLSSLPYAPYYGSDAVYYSGNIYVQAGYYKKDIWAYNILGGTWRRLPDIQGINQQDIGPYTGGTLESDGAGNLYSISSNSYYLNRFSISASNYPSSGTWTSNSIDLTYVSNWTSLSATTTTPGDSSISYQTRSSANGTTWSSWENVTGGTIASTANRYIQIKATLNSTTGGTDTPVIDDITITYQGDTDPPTNPTAFNGSSQEIGGTDLTSGNTYSYAHPYFTWSGADDTDTSVEGYYVYFGTTSDANPEESGSYQTGSTYVVTESLTNNTYYLRLKTKDTAGNISDATTGFIYVYQGVQPQTITIDDQEEFTGTPTNTAVANGQIKLTSKAGFWQQERLTYALAGLSYGAGWAYVASTGKLYTPRGGNNSNFYEYDIATDTWTAKSNTAVSIHIGGFVIEGPSGYLYAAAGNNRSNFMRYDIEQDTWSDEAASDPVNTIYYGGSAVYDGSQYIYITRGYNDDAFWRYDASGDRWETLANTQFRVGNTVYHGGELAYDGTDTIYALQGNARSGFSSYSISANEWSYLPDLPSIAYLGATIDYDLTTNAVYYIPGYGIGGMGNYLYKYDVSSNTWSQLTDVPYRLYYGGDIRIINGKMYVIRGENNSTIYTYDIANDVWYTPTQSLFGSYFYGTGYFNFNYGADIEKGAGNDYYLIRGNYDNLFIKYNPVTGITTELADAPVNFYNGSDLVYESTNNKIYATGSTVNTNFYQYDIATDTWSIITTDPLPATPGTGSSMAYDGSQYIYWARGGNTNTYYRYNIAGTAGFRWEARANFPSNAGTYPSYGSELVYKNGSIYTLQGNNRNPNPLYRYNADNSWTNTLTSLGIDVYNDGFMVSDSTSGNYLYASKGENTDYFYRYSISGDLWESMADFPGQLYQGAAAASNGSDKIYVIPGTGTNTYQDGVYTYIMQTAGSSFETSGNYVSQTHDLGGVYRFGNLTVDYTATTSAGLSVQTRSSANGTDWSSWSTASSLKSAGSSYQYEIKSTVNQYLQVKFALTSADGIYSGTIDSYTINYYQDNDPPTNPTDLTGYSTSTKSAQLTTNTWYGHGSPHFDWPDAEDTGGATDTSAGSGVTGYYVYFGTSSTVNATESGTLVTSSDYTASGLITDQTYYLRIQSIDDAGNYSTSNWQPFIYKYDNGAPTEPTTVVVNPSGYTNSDNYTFSWSGATDSASLVYGYCYKTGASGSTETCITEASASGAFKYQTGTNTFYLRTMDNAGNYSSYVTASYYYSGVSPGGPQNLRVTYPTGSSSNTVNEFAFAWDPPETYYGQQTSLRYYYWINQVPSASSSENSIGLSVTYLSKGAYAQDSGTNTLYVVAEDEAGNIDYNNYSSVTFTSATSAPGAPRNLDISDVSIKETSQWRLALSWDTPTSSGSGVAEYRIYRAEETQTTCPSDPSSSDDFTFVGTSTTQTSYVDTGLTQETKYYCVTACNYSGGRGCGVASDLVSAYPDGRWRVAPTLVSSPSATVKTKTATITWSTSRTANSFVKYGKSSGTYGDEVGSSTQVSSHEIDLTGLDPGTTYYFKALWTDEDGNTGESDEITFTTNPAPLISNVKVTNIGLYSAYVNFTVKNASSVDIKYGKTISYGSSSTMSVSTAETSNTVLLENLTDGTLYHLQLDAKDDEDNIYSSDDYTFETLPKPEIIGLKIQQVVGMPTTTLRIIWTSNAPITTIVTYYPTSNPELAKDQINLTLKKVHEVLITGLKDSASYSVSVRGKDSGGNEATYPIQALKTAADIRAPEILNLTAESTIIGVGSEARAQIIVCWSTDEPSTTQVEYGEGTGTSYGSTTQEDTNPTLEKCVTITGLRPQTITSFRAKSKDKSGNIGYSAPTILVTPKATKDALNLVVDKLAKTFGFLKGLKLSK